MRKISKKEKEKIKEFAIEKSKVIINEVEDIKTSNIRLYELFSEITILRMKLDKFDNFIKNFFDKKKRENNIEIRLLIKTQVKDIFENICDYDENNLNLINSVMNKLYPKTDNNWWSDFINAILKGLGFLNDK